MAGQTILLLDVMGTIVHDPFFWEVPNFFGLRMEQMLAQKHPTAWLEFERGEREESEYLQDFFADGRYFDHQAFCLMMQQSYYVLDGMEDLLTELKQRGVEMHALSNYPVWYRWIERRLQLSRFLEWTFVSCLTGLRKPAIASYQYVIESLGVSPEQCLFVDDRPRNCEAAEQTGMSALVFKKADILRLELQQRNILS